MFKFLTIKYDVLNLINNIQDNIDEYLESKPYGYLRFIDNWHKHPKISKIMCKMGRHDYEFDNCDKDGYGCLLCFYCDNKKKSKLIK